MLKYKGYNVPETVQEIMLCSNYHYAHPMLQLVNSSRNLVLNTGVTFEALTRDDFSLSQTIELCKKCIDDYNESEILAGVCVEDQHQRGL